MKNIQEMIRTEVLNDLRSYAHATWYQSLFSWRDEQLKALLLYYREGGTYPHDVMGEIHITPGLGPVPKKLFSIGIDFAKKEQERW